MHHTQFLIISMQDVRNPHGNGSYYETGVK